MKQASTATLDLLQSRQYLLAELYDITLVTGQVYHYTSFQVPLVAAVYPSATANLYGTGLVIKRGSITQKEGLEAGSMKLALSQQDDAPSGTVLIAGYPILQAARYGFLDGATVLFSKLFMAMPTSPLAALDTSPGAVGWFQGTVQEIEFDRMVLDLTVDDALAYLGQQQLPRQLFGAGCFHQVYDAGCTLLAANFTSTGTIASVGDAAHFTSNLTQADDYFDLGVVTFTSGVNNGQSANVSSYKNASGAIATNFPFPSKPAVGDTFNIYPGCDLQQSTCSAKFNNLAHFSGQPYIPVPETVLDGGTSNPPVQPQGRQPGNLVGSNSGGRFLTPGSSRTWRF